MRKKQQEYDELGNIVSEVTIQYVNKVKHKDMVSVTSSKSIYDILKSIFDPNTIQLKEYFYAIYLNRSNKILAVKKISEGGIAGTVVDLKELITTQFLLKESCRLNSTALIVAHNHPSGNPKPSQQDISMTKNIKQGLGLFNISLLDHIIVTADGYCSFSDEGLI